MRICTFQRYFSILKLLCTFGTYLYEISYRPESPRGTLDPGTFGVPPEPIYMEFRTLLNVPSSLVPHSKGLERRTGNGARYMARTIRAATLGTQGNAMPSIDSP